MLYFVAYQYYCYYLFVIFRRLVHPLFFVVFSQSNCTRIKRSNNDFFFFKLTPENQNKMTTLIGIDIFPKLETLQAAYVSITILSIIICGEVLQQPKWHVVFSIAGDGDSVYVLVLYVCVHLCSMSMSMHLFSCSICVWYNICNVFLIHGTMSS